jgi:hypothetical protein
MCHVKGCDQEFDASWRLSFGFFNKTQEETNSPMWLEVTLFTGIFSIYIHWPCFQIYFHL